MKKILLAGLSVLILTACSGPRYEVQGDVVVRSYWTFSFGTRCDTLPGADPSTFEQVADWLGHDSKHVYFEAKLVPGVDVATLKAKRYPLFCDKNDYYYETTPLHVADLESFKTIKWFDDDFWAKDSRCAYYDTVRIDGADLASFQVIEDMLARDKFNVYLYGLTLPGADPATFEIVKNSSFCRDKSHVWHKYKGNLLEGADPATFELIKNTNYCRDKSHVWYENGGVLLEGADPTTFEVIGETDYCRDKSHIWFRSDLLPDADYATFVADYQSFAHDKYGTFTADHRDTVEVVEGETVEP